MSVKPFDLLRYLPDFKVIVCTSCHYALQPQAISRHLKDIHHILRSHRKPYLQYISGFDLDDPEDVLRSVNHLREFPVPGLPVWDGLKCTYHGCFHLCITEKRMKSHWTLEHGRSGHHESDWVAAPLQTFFSGNSLRYFTKPPYLSTSVDLGPSRALPTDTDKATLFRHYITSTSLTLADGFVKSDENKFMSFNDTAMVISAVDDFSSKSYSTAVHIWQTIIPQLADENQYLMHGILACSALHLAYLNPSAQLSYRTLAFRHQDSAMPRFREALARFNDENCHAILAFIHLLAVYSFASEQENERLLIVDPNGPEIVSYWLLFLRSGCELVETVRYAVVNGPLAPLMCEWVKPMDVRQGAHSPLVSKLINLIPSEEHEDTWSDVECRIYRDAVYQLEYAYMCAKKLGKNFTTWDALRVWPVLLAPEYFELLRDLHPGALIVLAHYCHLLYYLDEKWYWKGRAQRLLKHIVVRLDSEWHAHVKLPVEQDFGLDMYGTVHSSSTMSV